VSYCSSSQDDDHTVACVLRQLYISQSIFDRLNICFNFLINFSYSMYQLNKLTHMAFHLKIQFGMGLKGYINNLFLTA